MLSVSLLYGGWVEKSENKRDSPHHEGILDVLGRQANIQYQNSVTNAQPEMKSWWQDQTEVLFQTESRSHTEWLMLEQNLKEPERQSQMVRYGRKPCIHSFILKVKIKILTSVITGSMISN